MKGFKKGNYHNLGDKLERIGERIGGKLGRVIYQLGNKLEHLEGDNEKVKISSNKIQ